MSVYKKLAQARVKLQNAGLKKSGKNKFANYDYFELCDFLPKINEINEELGICTVVKYDENIATLVIVDVDKSDSSITITSPMKDATLKGCHEIQNLGAVESYQRRYLYMTAYEIAENDILDGTLGKEDTDKQLTDAQINRLFAIAKSVGIDSKTVKSQVFTKFKITDIAKLTKSQYDQVCEGYENMKK